MKMTFFSIIRIFLAALTVFVPAYWQRSMPPVLPRAAVYQLKDIYTGAEQSFPFGFVELNGRVYFSVENASYGKEIWYSDGTPSGTQILKDILPGVQDGITYSTVVKRNNWLFFAADDGIRGTEIWQSDGTPAGTALLKEINPQGDADPHGFFASDGYVFFRASDQTGIHLWRTDGTADGTVKITTSPLDETNCPFSPLTKGAVFLGEYYFTATQDPYGCTLFRTNGMPGQVQRVEQAESDPRFYDRPEELTIFGNTLFFSAEGLGLGRELWAVDGNTGKAFLFLDINPGFYADSAPNEFIVFQNKLVFTATNERSETELWASDGSPSGTHSVPPLEGLAFYTFPAGKTIFGDTLIFQARDAEHGVELFQFDGNGVSLLKDIVVEEGTLNGDSWPHDFAVMDGQVLFAAASAPGYPNNNELWRTDGTVDGTVRVADIRPGIESSYPTYMFPVGNRVFFSADDGVHGRELWVYLMLPHTVHLPSVFR